ncbi:hypothetical protein [Clostridium perfringens]|uniref:hypothetical protein n=1 Tax=Clostridium perfringens TaxID=1502 RepID=UPI001C8448CB|nr:hypothetical protein [Clostridium perfringens]
MMKERLDNVKDKIFRFVCLIENFNKNVEHIKDYRYTEDDKNFLLPMLTQISEELQRIKSIYYKCSNDYQTIIHQLINGIEGLKFNVNDGCDLVVANGYINDIKKVLNITIFK